MRELQVKYVGGNLRYTDFMGRGLRFDRDIFYDGRKDVIGICNGGVRIREGEFRCLSCQNYKITFQVLMLPPIVLSDLSEILGMIDEVWVGEKDIYVNMKGPRDYKRVQVCYA